jgi:hypothetical protein
MLSGMPAGKTKTTDKIRPEASQAKTTSSQAMPIAAQPKDLSRLARNMKTEHNDPANTSAGFAHSSNQADGLPPRKYQARTSSRDVLSREGQKDDLLSRSKKVRRHVVQIASGCSCSRSLPCKHQKVE